MTSILQRIFLNVRQQIICWLRKVVDPEAKCKVAAERFLVLCRKVWAKTIMQHIGRSDIVFDRRYQSFLHHLLRSFSLQANTWMRFVSVGMLYRFFSSSWSWKCHVFCRSSQLLIDWNLLHVYVDIRDLRPKCGISCSSIYSRAHLTSILCIWVL